MTLNIAPGDVKQVLLLLEGLKHKVKEFPSKPTSEDFKDLYKRAASAAYGKYLTESTE